MCFAEVVTINKLLLSKLATKWLMHLVLDSVQMDIHGPVKQHDSPYTLHILGKFLDTLDCLRHGQALDLQDDYLSETVKQGKENAAPGTNTKPDDNWPEVEIRVANKRPGLLRPLLAASSAHFLHDTYTLLPTFQTRVFRQARHCVSTNHCCVSAIVSLG